MRNTDKLNLSGSFVRVLVKASMLVTYKLPDNLPGQIQFVRVIFSLLFNSMFFFSELIDLGAIKL